MVLQQLSIIPTGIRSSMASKLARIDWGGSALCIAGSTLVLLGLTFSSDGWATGKTIGTLVSGAVVLALFVVYEIKVPAEPAVPMRLFKSRGFTFAALATLCTGEKTMLFAISLKGAILTIIPFDRLGYDGQRLLPAPVLPVGPRCDSDRGSRHVSSLRMSHVCCVAGYRCPLVENGPVG